MTTSRRRFMLTSLAASMAATAPWQLHAAGGPASALTDHDGLGLADLVRRKEVTPLELVEATLERIAALNPPLNAVLTKLFDPEVARKRAQSPLSGPFAGVPVMLKNLTEYKDADIDGGSRFNRLRVERNGRIDKVNSPFVDAMERAGMVVTGITSSPEFGLIETTEPLLHGATHNPWNLGRTCGGSSGGSGAAVAAGIVPIAHGNDGGGSIRVPASQCGVFGLKPTRARELGSAGHDPLAISSDLCLTRSVRDAAAFLAAVERRDDPVLPPVGFIADPDDRPLRIAFLLEGLSHQQPDAEVTRGLRTTAALCEELGHRLEEVPLFIDGPEFFDAFIGLWSTFVPTVEAQVAEIFGAAVKPEDVLEPWTLGLGELAKSRGVEACLTRAQDVFARVTTAVEKLFQTYDVLLSPVMRTPPYEIGWHAPTVPFETLLPRVIDDVPYTPLHNAAGTPAMSVPLHWTKDGLPVGSQFAAWRGGDAMLLRLAYQLERAAPWAEHRPPV